MPANHERSAQARRAKKTAKRKQRTGIATGTRVATKTMKLAFNWFDPHATDPWALATQGVAVAAAMVLANRHDEAVTMIHVGLVKATEADTIRPHLLAVADRAVTAAGDEQRDRIDTWVATHASHYDADPDTISGCYQRADSSDTHTPLTAVLYAAAAAATAGRRDARYIVNACRQQPID